MPRFTTRQRLGQNVSRFFGVLRRKFLDGLQLALQLEAEIIQRPLQNERTVLAT
jgi:hypothetical protein